MRNAAAFQQSAIFDFNFYFNMRLRDASQTSKQISCPRRLIYFFLGYDAGTPCAMLRIATTPASNIAIRRYRCTAAAHAKYLAETTPELIGATSARSTIHLKR